MLAGAALVLLLATPAGAQDSFEARLDTVVRDLEKDSRFRGLSTAQRRDRIEFVAGNVLFALMHEVGHMSISEMGLPVLGREEDAADAFATLVGLTIGTAFSERILMQSARGWFISDRRNRKEKIAAVYYLEHGLDQQRAYNIVCLMVGSNPEKFSELAAKTKLPPERQAGCMGDYSNASWSWNKVLAPHVRSSQPKTNISVAYLDGGEELSIFARGFRQIRILETVAEHLSERYVWRRPLALEMRSCGESAARWELTEQKIVVCYELAAEFAQLHRNYATSPEPVRSVARRR
jgi:hypothetical protein